MRKPTTRREILSQLLIVICGYIEWRGGGRGEPSGRGTIGRERHAASSVAAARAAAPPRRRAFDASARCGVDVRAHANGSGVLGASSRRRRRRRRPRRLGCADCFPRAAAARQSAPPAYSPRALALPLLAAASAPLRCCCSLLCVCAVHFYHAM